MQPGIIFSSVWFSRAINFLGSKMFRDANQYFHFVHDVANVSEVRYWMIVALSVCKQAAGQIDETEKMGIPSSKGSASPLPSGYTHSFDPPPSPTLVKRSQRSTSKQCKEHTDNWKRKLASTQDTNFCLKSWTISRTIKYMKLKRKSNYYIYLPANNKRHLI